VLLVALAALAGAGLAELGETAAGTVRRRLPAGEAGGGLLRAGVALALVAATVAAGARSPDGAGPGPHPVVLQVAAVQGGGPRGLRGIDVDPAVVFQRHLAASTSLPPGLDLVVWPEDVLSVAQPVATTPEAGLAAALARRLRTSLEVGVVEDAGPGRFRNAAVVWSPEGSIAARYDKVHRVPFGEYVPARGFFSHLVDLSVIPNDEVPGHGTGVLLTPAGPLGVVISFEVFFDDRARAAVRAGGQVLVVPTNASSYRTSQVPTQEVAAARIRAWRPAGTWSRPRPPGTAP
jgi:apolipoprotein N-acyltransferase